MPKHDDEQKHLPATIDNLLYSSGETKRMSHKELVRANKGNPEQIALLTLQLDSYRPYMDSVKHYVDIYGSSSKIGLYATLNKQLAAKAQMNGLNDPNATRKQRICLIAMMEDVYEAHTQGFEMGLDSSAIKVLRNERTDKTSLFFNLGTKKARKVKS